MSLRGLIALAIVAVVLAGTLVLGGRGRHGCEQSAPRVRILPAVNVLGLNTRSRLWPFDGSDLNRMFPGYDAGETTQRIASAVLAATEPAESRVDAHRRRGLH